MKAQINFGELSGGEPKRGIEPNVSTETTIPLPFEPTIIICKFSYSASDFVIVTYNKEFDDTNQYCLRTDNNGEVVSKTQSGNTGLGGRIQSITSSGFSVKSNASYKNCEWVAFG